MQDSQKKGSNARSGGQRIDDHSFWAGGPGKDMVMPQGVHTKAEHSDGHTGEVRIYEDTSEKIAGSQKMAERDVRKQPRKEFHRY